MCFREVYHVLEQKLSDTEAVLAMEMPNANLIKLESGGRWHWFSRYRLNVFEAQNSMTWRLPSTNHPKAKEELQALVTCACHIVSHYVTRLYLHQCESLWCQMSFVWCSLNQALTQPDTVCNSAMGTLHSVQPWEAWSVPLCDFIMFNHWWRGADQGWARMGQKATKLITSGQHRQRACINLYNWCRYKRLQPALHLDEHRLHVKLSQFKPTEELHAALGRRPRSCRSLSERMQRHAPLSLHAASLSKSHCCNTRPNDALQVFLTLDQGISLSKQDGTCSFTNGPPFFEWNNPFAGIQEQCMLLFAISIHPKRTTARRIIAWFLL